MSWTLYYLVLDFLLGGEFFPVIIISHRLFINAAMYVLNWLCVCVFIYLFVCQLKPNEI